MKRSKQSIALLLCILLMWGLCACRDDRLLNGVPTPEQPSSRNGSQQEESESAEVTDQGEQSTQKESASGDEAEPINKPTQIRVVAESRPVAFAGILKGAAGGTLPSGLIPLDEVEYTVIDPQNTRELSTKKLSHSHGPAKDGKPHETVAEFQDLFDRFGALTLDRKSSGNVLYLTFDCGYEYENLTSVILDTLKEKNVPAAFFCTRDHIVRQPELIARMIREGHIVGNHSDTHPSFPGITRTQMKDEIEKTENELRRNFGYCAKFFRFPAGEYSENALDLVQSLGYCSVFWSVAYNDWDVNRQQGKDNAVRIVTERLHPGAVILLHAVSRDNADALGEIIDRAREEGYVFRALTDYPFG